MPGSSRDLSKKEWVTGDKKHKIDGYSFKEVLLKNTDSSQHKWILGMGGGNNASLTKNGVENQYFFRDRVLRNERYKLCINTKKEPEKHFDLLNDPFERNNLLDSLTTDEKKNNFHQLYDMVKTFLYLFLFATVIWLISYIQNLLGFPYEITFSIVILSLVLLLFWLGYFMIPKYDLFQLAAYEEEEFTKNEVNKKLSSKTDAYYQNLLKVMNHDKLYTDTDLTLKDLFEHLGISGGYLSQIINERTKNTFFEFVNSYRIKVVKKKLISTEYKRYAIMGIALESGFKSKSTFNTVFKEYTRLTPSAYKKRTN